MTKELLQKALDSKTKWAAHCHQKAGAAYVTYDGSASDLNELARYVDRLESAVRAAIAQPASTLECTRSHPHENMDELCKLRTIIARLENEKAIAQPVQPAAQAAQPTDAERPNCIWTEQDNDDMSGTYASDCGDMWSFTDGGVEENNVRFCQGCGKPVSSIAASKGAA